MTDDLERVERALAQSMVVSAREGVVERRQGVIDAINTDGTVDVVVGGVVVPGMSYKRWYRPVVDDVVFLEVIGTDFIVDGPLANATGQTDQGTVGTSESTGSGAFVDLATAGPAVTIATGDVAVVTLSAQMVGVVGVPIMGFEVSGATARAASDTEALLIGGGVTMQASRVMRIGGLTSGVNTFTMKYRTTAGTGTFERRSIMVETLA